MKLNEVESLEDILNQHCSQAVSSTIPLFRGLVPKTRKEGEHFVAAIRTDRQPRSSSEESVAIFDKFIQLNGWGFRKSNTLSVAQQPQIAARYGSVYRVYPFDGAQYLGSTQYEDFISIPIKIRNLWSKANWEMVPPDGEPHPEYPTIDEYMEQNLEELTRIAGLFVSHNLEDMQPSVGEILVLGTKYVAVDARNHSDAIWHDEKLWGSNGSHF